MHPPDSYTSKPCIPQDGTELSYIMWSPTLANHTHQQSNCASKGQKTVLTFIFYLLSFGNHLKVLSFTHCWQKCNLSKKKILCHPPPSSTKMWYSRQFLQGTNSSCKMGEESVVSNRDRHTGNLCNMHFWVAKLAIVMCCVSGHHTGLTYYRWITIMHNVYCSLALWQCSKTFDAHSDTTHMHSTLCVHSFR